jgi:hypothetical protein
LCFFLNFFFKHLIPILTHCLCIRDVSFLSPQLSSALFLPHLLPSILCHLFLPFHLIFNMNIHIIICMNRGMEINLNTDIFIGIIKNTSKYTHLNFP